jgi:HK97 family phage major capsid protein
MSHKQAVNRLKDISEEIERLSNKAEENGGLDAADEATWNEYVEESRSVDEYRKHLERDADRERIQAIANAGTPRSRLRLESGSDSKMDSDPIGEPDSIEEHRFRNPWDLSEVRMGLTPGQRGLELHSRALSAVEKAPGMTDDRRETASKILEDWDTRDGKLAEKVLALSDPNYLTAFMKIAPTFAHGSEAFTDVERAAFTRAMSLTDAAGGYLIPFQLDPAVIMTSDGSFNEIRQIARKVQAIGDVWSGVSAGAVSWSFDAEAAAVSDDAPTFAQPTVTIRTARGFVPISLEAFQDAANVTNEIGMLLAEGKDILEAQVFATGVAGSNQPVGLITALVGTGSIVTSTTTDTFAVGDVHKVYNALPARYRARGRASWLANNLIYGLIRGFDTAGGASFWANLGEGRPEGLLGRPAYEAEAMDGVINAIAENYVLVVGDFSNYVIADRIGMTVEFIPNLFDPTTARPTGQKGWFAYYRVGANVVNVGGFRLLNVT